MQTWSDVLGQEKLQPYFQETLNFVRNERESGKIIYPPAADVFNAFKYTEFSDVNVVILGQDPYHGPNQAHGLCFSVLPGVATPPSLVAPRNASASCSAAEVRRMVDVGSMPAASGG